MITTKLKLAEKSKIIYDEHPNYTKAELLADIGGSLGLILGLNLLDVFVFSGSLMRIISKKATDLYYLCFPGRKRNSSKRSVRFSKRLQVPNETVQSKNSIPYSPVQNRGNDKNGEPGTS